MGFFSDWCVILFGSGVALQELDARNAEKKKMRQDAPPSFSANNSPAFNVDGSPMMGAFDIHGRPFGSVTPISGGSRMFSDGQHSMNGLH
jgi:hypothetical protein